MIFYKLWIKLLLKNKKLDGFIWSVPWTLKRDVIDVWLASEMYADMGKKKWGIIIAKVDFCITNTPTILSVGDYDNTQIEYIIFQSTVSYWNIQYILKKSIGNILYILNCSFYLIEIKFDIFDINVIGLNS